MIDNCLLKLQSLSWVQPILCGRGFCYLARKSEAVVWYSDNHRRNNSERLLKAALMTELVKRQYLLLHASETPLFTPHFIQAAGRMFSDSFWWKEEIREFKSYLFPLPPYYYFIFTYQFDNHNIGWHQQQKLSPLVGIRCANIPHARWWCLSTFALLLKCRKLGVSRWPGGVHRRQTLSHPAIDSCRWAQVRASDAKAGRWAICQVQQGL